MSADSQFEQRVAASLAAHPEIALLFQPGGAIRQLLDLADQQPQLVAHRWSDQYFESACRELEGELDATAKMQALCAGFWEWAHHRTLQATAALEALYR